MHSHARAGEKVDQFIDAETADLSLEQIAHSRLSLVEKSSGLSLCPAARGNVLTQIEHEIGAYLEIRRGRRAKPEILEYVFTAAGDFILCGFGPPLGSAAGRSRYRVWPSFAFSFGMRGVHK